MSAYYVDNIFSPDQVEYIHSLINNTVIPEVDGEYVAFEDNNGTGLCKGLGRLQIGNLGLRMPDSMKSRMYEILSSVTDSPMAISHALYVEYNAKYGQPNLPPHFDGDTNDFIINYQLDANTAWDLGIDLDTYTLENNSALIFNANTSIHWRTHKEFKEGEYVKMLFVRFYNSEVRSDYSHVPMNQTDQAFVEARAFRDSLKSSGI